MTSEYNRGFLETERVEKGIKLLTDLHFLSNDQTWNCEALFINPNRFQRDAGQAESFFGKEYESTCIELRTMSGERQPG